MINGVCFYQENRLSESHREELDSALAALASAYFDEDLEIAWTEIAAGNGWTGVGPATGSNMALFVPDMPDDKREALLKEICSHWMRITDCKITEIVASAINRER